METKTITTAQAAKRLGVSPQTVQKWVDAGFLPAWKTVGGHRRLDVDAVDRMVTSRRSGGPATEPKRPSILLVEDNPIIATLFEAQLQVLRPDAELRIFRDGFSALLDAGRQVPELLITDINLPGLDGVAMVRQLRENPATRPMRIVLVTSYGPGELERFGSLPEGVPVLHKPLTMEALGAAVGAVGAVGAAGSTAAD